MCDYGKYCHYRLWNEKALVNWKFDNNKNPTTNNNDNNICTVAYPFPGPKTRVLGYPSAN